MGFNSSGIGFIGSSGSGGGGGTVITQKQYVVGVTSGAPADGSSVWNISPGINGNNLFLSIRGMDDLFQGTEYTFVTSGGKITQITLLEGFLFNNMQLITILAYT